MRGASSAAEQPRFDAAVAAARAHVFDEGVAQKLDSREAAKVYETPDIALEAMRGTVAAALDTVAKLDALKVLRPIATDATRFTPEHAALWRELAAEPRYKGNAFIQRYAKQGVPQFIYVLKGVLSGIDLALKVADEKKRATLLHAVGSEYDVSFRGGVHDVMVVVQATEALFTAGGMFVYASMRALGMADDAAIWFKAFTAAKPAEGLPKLALAKANYLTDLGWRIPLRTLSFVTSGLQLVHGVAVLLNSSSTDSERLEAYWEGGLGIAGLTGAGATGLNITWLAGIAGPATAGLLAGGLATYLGRAHIRELQVANSTEFVADALRLPPDRVGADRTGGQQARADAAPRRACAGVVRGRGRGGDGSPCRAPSAGAARLDGARVPRSREPRPARPQARQGPVRRRQAPAVGREDAAPDARGRGDVPQHRARPLQALSAHGRSLARRARPRVQRGAV